MVLININKHYVTIGFLVQPFRILYINRFLIALFDRFNLKYDL